MKKLSDIIPIIPTTAQLQSVKGIEENLLRRRRISSLSVIVALAGAILQVVNIFSPETNYVENLGKFFSHLIKWRWDQLVGPEGIPMNEFIGFLVLVIGAGTYFLLRWTKFLIKESEEPFQYTFWIELFKEVKETPPANENNRFSLLHHDLMERLNERIRRLSLLDLNASKPDAVTEQGRTSHIHISGHYAIREDENKKWIVHVMPRVRIGPPGNPATLSEPVKYPLEKEEAPESLDADNYNQLVERVYSSVATEVYRQIESDVKGKIDLFPTAYLRAVALFHEAEDFARSNTVDAYDRATELYKEAQRYFSLANIVRLSDLLIRCPLLWRLEVKFKHMQARVQIGYAKCLIYRREISALSGRRVNPLFEISSELEKTIQSLKQLYEWMSSVKKNRKSFTITRHLIEGLRKEKIPDRRLKNLQSHENQVIIGQNTFWETIHKAIGYPLAVMYKELLLKSAENTRSNTFMTFLTFPKDSWFRKLLLCPSEALFQRQKRILFDAYVTDALAHYFLGAIKKAEEYLDKAKAVNPQLSEINALYLLAAGAIEPDLNTKILLFRQATESAPSFLIAQFFLAQYSEILFRRQNEIVKTRAESVIKEYEKVLKINPGITAALAAQGYLWWLLGDLEKAKKIFEEGCEIKTIVSETFIGELNYGLARIAAEEGRFNESYDLYTQAIFADPEVAAYSVTSSSQVMTSYYFYIVPGMLKRYEDFRTTVEKFYKQPILFHLDPRFQNDLDNNDLDNNISADLCQVFIKNRISLSQNAKVSMEKRNKQWVINDGYQKYIVRKKTNRLNVSPDVSKRVLKAVYSFALNDYGNACFNYYFRFGDKDRLEEAMKAFDKAIKEYHQNAVAKYNFHAAYRWLLTEADKEKAVKYIEEAVDSIPTWQAALISLTQSQARILLEEIDRKDKEIQKNEKLSNVLEKDLKRLQEEEHALKQSSQRFKEERHAREQKIKEPKATRAAVMGRKEGRIDTPGENQQESQGETPKEILQAVPNLRIKELDTKIEEKQNEFKKLTKNLFENYFSLFNITRIIAI